MALRQSAATQNPRPAKFCRNERRAALVNPLPLNYTGQKSISWSPRGRPGEPVREPVFTLSSEPWIDILGRMTRISNDFSCRSNCRLPDNFRPIRFWLL